MGCRESKTKQGGVAARPPGSPKAQSVAAGDGEGAKPTQESMSPAAQIASASPLKSAMKKRPATEGGAAPTSPGGLAGDGRVGSAAPNEPADEADETALMDRSFVKEDLTGSFRNHSFVSEKGDCRIEKGVMAPSATKIPVSSSSDIDSVEPSPQMALLSPHGSDGDLVLVCIDCGREITERELGMLCPVTAKLHG